MATMKILLLMLLASSAKRLAPRSIAGSTAKQMAQRNKEQHMEEVGTVLQMNVQTYNCKPLNEGGVPEKHLAAMENVMTAPEYFDFIGTQEECMRALIGTSKGNVLTTHRAYATTGAPRRVFWGAPIVYSKYRWTEEASGTFTTSNPRKGKKKPDKRPCNWGIYSKNIRPFVRDKKQSYTVLFVNCHFSHSDGVGGTLKPGSDLMDQVKAQVEAATETNWAQKSFDQVWITGDMNEYSTMHAGSNRNGYAVKLFNKRLTQGSGADQLRTLGKRTYDRIYFWTAHKWKYFPRAEVGWHLPGASDHKPVKLKLELQ